ncbi:MAG: ExbD/TolR family protein [Gammaproteobacteria bacterium]
MKLQSGNREEPEVNLTSLIDVVLLLLVFFMVSTTFVKESEVKIRLPQAKADVPVSTSDVIEIAVSSTGSYTVNQQSLVNSRADTLRRALRKVSEGDSSLPITIRADAEAKHQHVVTAMDVAGRLGFVNINIATTRESATE